MGFYGYWLHPESCSGGIVTSRAELETLRDSDALVEQVSFAEYQKAKEAGWEVEWTENEQL